MRPPLAAVAVAALLLTSGCLGVFGPSRPAADERAVEAVERSRTAVDDVSSYRVALDGRLRATAEDERLTVAVSGGGPVNVSRREMKATVGIEQLGGTAAVNEGTRTTYVSGYTAYSECARIGWGRQNLSEEVDWPTYAPLGQQLALLNRTPVYWRGTDTVNGTEAAVVVAYPTTKEFRSVPTVRGTDATVFGGTKVQNVTIKMWVDRATHRPLKVQRRIRVEANGNAATATVTYRVRDYGDHLTVRRPSLDEAVRWDLGCPGSD